jgi:hypothetical protein
MAEDQGTGLNLQQLSIRDECEAIARKHLKRVDDAIQMMLESPDPYRGVLAWERVAEFAVAKKSKEIPAPPATQITINMLPATREDSQYIDITDQKEISSNFQDVDIIDD